MAKIEATIKKGMITLPLGDFRIMLMKGSAIFRLASNDCPCEKCYEYRVKLWKHELEESFPLNVAAALLKGE